MAKPIGPLFRSEVIIITPIRRRRPKRLRIFALFMLTLFGIYYFMELSFGSSKKYDILIILTNDVCSKGGHDLGTMNNGGAPSRFHCVMKCSGKSHAHSGGGNSCGRLMLVLGAKNSSPIIVCENPTNNVVTIIPEILNGVNWPEVLTNTATLDSIKNRYNTDKKISEMALNYRQGLEIKLEISTGPSSRTQVLFKKNILKNKAG